jgi:hypothetical protein
MNRIKHLIVSIQLFQITIKIICHRLRVDIMTPGLPTLFNPNLGKLSIS